MATLLERRQANKRERVAVQRYSDASYEKPVIVGDGKKLVDIPEIKAAMKTWTKDDDFHRIVHKALYGTEGTQEKRKKDIKEFQGIKGETEEETKAILEKRKEFLERQTYAALIEMCRIFCLAGAGKEKTKEKYAEEIVKFLEKPGSVKIVVTEKSKLADIAEPVVEEEEKPKKKPVTKAKKEEKAKTPKKEAKKEKKETKATPKKGGKKEKAETPKKKATTTPKKEGKKETKATPKKTAAKKEEKTPKKVGEKKEGCKKQCKKAAK